MNNVITMSEWEALFKEEGQEIPANAKTGRQIAKERRAGLSSNRAWIRAKIAEGKLREVKYKLPDSSGRMSPVSHYIPVKKAAK